MVRAQQGRIDEAITEAEALMSLPEIRIGTSSDVVVTDMTTDSVGTALGHNKNRERDSARVVGIQGSGGSGAMHTDSLRLTEEDRVNAFIAYATLLSKAWRVKESNKVLSEAKMAFAGTPQEVQVLVAASHLAVERKDFDTAIRTLDKIASDSPPTPVLR